MAVIINEFEAVVEPPRQPESEPDAQSPRDDGDGAAAMSPLAIEAVLRQRLDRALRLLAD